MPSMAVMMATPATAVAEDSNGDSFDVDFD
jgi:hypothetical protein